MNSSKSYQLRVDYSALEKRVLALFSQPIESIQNLPRADCKSDLSLMWSQRSYGVGIVELLRNFGPQSGLITSSDNSLRGTRADLLVHDEVQLIQE